MIRRGTPEYDLMLDIVKHKTYVLDEHVRRINGRYVKVAYMQFDDDGQVKVNGDEAVVKWKRLRIPRNHPWRGVRPKEAHRG